MRRHLPEILHVLSIIASFFSLSFLLPLAWSWATQDGATQSFALGFACAFSGSLGLYFITRPYRRELKPRDGFLLVTLVWTVLPFLATVPLLHYFAQVGQPLSFADAYFESMSGLTTTGATVLSGLDQLPQSINLWRCLLSWLGGMGIIVLALAVLPLLGVGGSQIYKAEIPGPMKDQKLTPRITDTAKGLYTVYLVLSVTCFLAYWAAGMSPFDAMVHMFTTVSLGGFSAYDASFGHFDSAAIEWVAIGFMLIAGINFAIHFTAWHHRSIGPYRRCPEATWFLIACFMSSLLIAALLLVEQPQGGPLDTLRTALFNVVSVATTTGYASTDYAQWPIFAPVLMILLSCFASSAGSTGGGIKMIRAVLLFKQARRELTRVLHPRAVNPVQLGNQLIDNKVIFSILAFMLMYGVTVIVMTLVLLLTGVDPVTAFTAIIASINSLGPGLGEVGPSGSFQGFNDFQVWVCTITMLLGRLELFTVMVLFTADYWRR